MQVAMTSAAGLLDVELLHRTAALSLSLALLLALALIGLLRARCGPPL
jgi:hypothetical protein